MPTKPPASSFVRGHVCNFTFSIGRKVSAERSLRCGGRSNRWRLAQVNASIHGGSSGQVVLPSVAFQAPGTGNSLSGDLRITCVDAISQEEAAEVDIEDRVPWEFS